MKRHRASVRYTLRIVMRFGIPLFAGASLLLASACDGVGDSANPATDATAAHDAPLRFGSHKPCTTDNECPDDEACAYAIALGCDAPGECVTARECSTDPPPGLQCLCDGGSATRRSCWEYYSEVPIQAYGACPIDAGAEASACVSPKAGEACSANRECCAPAFCFPSSNPTCCVPWLTPCESDQACCGGFRCTQDHATFRRCL